MTWHLSTRIIGRELFVIYREKEVILCSEENGSELREREIRNNYVIWEDNCSVMREKIDTRCNYVFIGRQLFGYESNYDMHRLVEATKVGYKRFCRERYEYQQMIDCR